MDQQNDQDQEYKLPEFVDVTEEYEEHQEFRGIPRQTAVDIPFYVRFIALFCCVGVAIWVSLMIFLTLLFGLFSALTLFKNDRLVEILKGFWEKVCRNTVIALGLFVAVFSPQLGLVFIVSYFMMKDEQWQEGVMGQVFSQYYHTESE